MANLTLDSKTVRKILLKFLEIVKIKDKRTEKFGGPGKIVQVDETALNFKIKSHRGRSPINKTDALCIIEYEEEITGAFACVISDKKASTTIQIICQNVETNSTIYTDEHKSYSSLNNLNFNHQTVCHKYKFVNEETGVNT